MRLDLGRVHLFYAFTDTHALIHTHTHTREEEEEEEENEGVRFGSVRQNRARAFFNEVLKPY